MPHSEQLLTAFDSDPPRPFAAGPFSDRNPIPTDDGLPSQVQPENGFLSFLPLTRTQELAWRLEIYGSAACSVAVPMMQQPAPSSVCAKSMPRR